MLEKMSTILDAQFWFGTRSYWSSSIVPRMKKIENPTMNKYLYLKSNKAVPIYTGLDAGIHQI